MLSSVFRKFSFFALGLILIATHALLPNESAATTAQILNIGNGAEPKDLDPQLITGIPETRIVNALFESLVNKDPKTLAPTPGVAESWKISKDATVYTFKLRKNAKWSNGEPVTSADFVYAWTRLLDPKTAAEYAYQGYYIKNGKAFNTGKLKDVSKLGMKAPDPYTFEVTLEEPTPYFLSLIFHHSLTPVPKATLEKFGARWTRPENMVSNGAFVLDKWEINKVISLKPNPKYWDGGKTKLTQVNFFPIDKKDTEEKMFRAGELHITEEVPLEKVEYWKKDKTGVFTTFPYLGTYFYWFNVKRPPVDNKLVRQALTLAIDRDRIVKYITRGGQAPGTHFSPPAGGYVPAERLPRDGSQFAKAKELLAKAGYPGGKGMPALEILYNTHDGHKKIAEAIQQMWKENLGIEAKLFNQEWKVFLDTQRVHNFQIARAGWIGDYNDPTTFFDMLETGNGNNRSDYSNKEYDALLEKAGAESNEKKRWAIFQKAEDILLEELPILPIYIYTRVFLKSKAVEGWYPNIEDIHPLQYVSLK